MKIISAILALSVSSAALASCPEMAKKAVSKYKKSSPVTSSTYAAFSKAFQHYRSEIARDSEFKPYIERSAAYFKGGKVSGFEVTISMGGDEDTLRYVMNEKKEIIVAYWYNQSPWTYWFCGEGRVVSEDYTDEGTEIR